MAKEILKCNENPETLFVGVGGIGSDIVVRVANRCMEQEKASGKPGAETQNIRFVVMDTDANALKDVKDSTAPVSFVQTSSTLMVGEYLNNDESARLQWFPNNTTLYSKTVSNGAGQVRAISRLALNATIRTGQIRPLYKAIDDLFLKDGGMLKQSLRVVIVSSVAGGTGSGIAMIVGMLVRQYLHDHYPEKAAVIRGMLLLPGVLDKVIPTEAERVSLRRNGYATIKEINAFKMKARGFCDVRKELNRYRDLHIDVPTTSGGIQRLECLPFDFCFLLDQVDNNQSSMMSLDQYKEFAANSLYEQNIGPMQRHAFSMEDNIIKDFAEAENLGRNSFGGVGASVLCYPYQEIVEYVAYCQAISQIGSATEAGAWLKYDKEYELKFAEFKKKRSLYGGVKPEIEDVYVESFAADKSLFGRDLQGYFIQDGKTVQEVLDDRIKQFLDAFDEAVKNFFVSLPDVKPLHIAALDIAQEKPYAKEPKYRGKAVRNLSSLRDYESKIKKNATRSAEACAKSLLVQGPGIRSAEVQACNIETLLKTEEGAMHPNAARYVLYALLSKLKAKNRDLETSPDTRRALDGLKLYSASTEDPDTFDLGYTGKVKEKNIDDVCRCEKKDVGFFDEHGGYASLWTKLNEVLPGYSKILSDYRDYLLKEASYRVAVEYLIRLCDEYRRFFSSFETKAVSLVKRRDEIVRKLEFDEGDSVCYVCATQDHLDALAASCILDDGLLLPDDLNADIFEAVKKNAEVARAAEFDPNARRTDIFDKILLKHYVTAVSADCDEQLDMNILQALLKEQELNALFKSPDGGDTAEFSSAQRLAYIQDALSRGQQFASPGIGYTSFEEARIVPVCAFNTELADLIDWDLKKIAEDRKLNAVFSGAVSRYELRSFCALYGITPDKLSRFKCSNPANLGDREGIYHQAYQRHMKKIGPDSTKCSAISLHVDKRWDSITELPELSMSGLKEEMTKIHKALIRGVVHGMIQTRPYSRYDEDKRIFVLEDDEGDYYNFTVSNRTECDLFYEILDALYRDRATVEKIFTMSASRCQDDIDANRRYDETSFVRDVQEFSVPSSHQVKTANAPSDDEAFAILLDPKEQEKENAQALAADYAKRTSVFEIPLVYFNSLPRAKMDDNELSVMIDAVISVLEEEIALYEAEVDRAPYLIQRLEHQFRLFVYNFRRFEDLQKNTQISENRVVQMVLRKITNKMKAENAHNCVARINALRDLIKESSQS